MYTVFYFTQEQPKKKYWKGGQVRVIIKVQNNSSLTTATSSEQRDGDVMSPLLKSEVYTPAFAFFPFPWVPFELIFKSRKFKWAEVKLYLISLSETLS